MSSFSSCMSKASPDLDACKAEAKKATAEAKAVAETPLMHLSLRPSHGAERRQQPRRLSNLRWISRQVRGTQPGLRFRNKSKPNSMVLSTSDDAEGFFL